LSTLNKYISTVAFGLYLILANIVYYLRKVWIGLVILLLVVFVLLFKSQVVPDYDKTIYVEAERQTVLVPKGASLREIAVIMQEHDVLQHSTFFIYLGKISGYQNKLQAGLFTVPEGMHPWHLLKYLTQPELARVKVTIPEGLETTEIAGILAARLSIDSTRFMEYVTDTSFCQRVGVEQSSLEGYLLPETYFFHYAMDEEDIILTLLVGMFEIFEIDSVIYEMERLRMNRHEIITLASIIEGEVVVDSERVLVSSVYHNRLRRGWLLGADPTIQYIIPGPPRRLLNADLEIDSPYNTYKYRGLPPGPINNPGKSSVLAAVFPADTRYMYFVASGDGGHRFSRTAAEHARWKANFDQHRREVRRKERQKQWQNNN
jgi:UPF0755 protein